MRVASGKPLKGSGRCPTTGPFPVNTSAFPRGLLPTPHGPTQCRLQPAHGPSQERASWPKLSEQGPAEGHNLPSSLSIQHSPHLFPRDTDVLGSRPRVWEKVPCVDLFPMVPVGVGSGPHVVTSRLVWQQLPVCWGGGVGLSQEGNNRDRCVTCRCRVPAPRMGLALAAGLARAVVLH